MGARKATDKEIALAIRALTDGNGYPPTFRELAAYVGMKSSNTISARLKRMRFKKLLTYEDWKPRTLRLTDRGESLANEPA